MILGWPPPLHDQWRGRSSTETSMTFDGGGTATPESLAILNSPDAVRKRCRVRGREVGTARAGDMLGAGKLKATIRRTWPLNEMAEAHRALQVLETPSASLRQL